MKVETTYIVNVYQSDKTALQKVIRCDDIAVIGESIILKHKDVVVGVFPSCMTSIVEKQLL